MATDPLISEGLPLQGCLKPLSFPSRRKLLVFNPSKRLSPDQALRHPYVAQFHNSADEPSAGRVYVLPISDNTKYTVGEYRDRLYSEILKKKKEMARLIKEKEAQRGAGARRTHSSADHHHHRDSRSK